MVLQMQILKYSYTFIKKCFTNGIIPNVTVHMMWEDYKQYKEELAYIQHSQFYIALKKLSLHNIISIKNGVDGRYTIKLTHFTNEETKKGKSICIY